MIGESHVVARLFVRTLTSLSLAALASFALAGNAQDVEVTFYSNGNPYTTVAPHADHAMFVGTLFDGKQPIGFLQPKRFLTLYLSPGPHTFSGSLSRKKPDEKSQLSLDLTAGVSYFIRAQMEVRGVVITSEKDRLDSVTCQIAHQEAEKALPTDPKRIEPAMRPKITSVSSLPSCK
jgi:hypothetical protein